MITEALVRESTEGPKRFVPTLRDALDALLGCQESDGHWCGELQGDSILESEYLLMKFILGQEQAPMADGRPASKVLPRIASYLRSLQRSDGGWGQYPGSDIDVSATVKAYFVLKLMGDDPSAEHMAKARGRLNQLLIRAERELEIAKSLPMVIPRPRNDRFERRQPTLV